MTEAEWLDCTDCTPMLKFLRSEASERKLRLFAVACCRQVWELLPDPDEWMSATLPYSQQAVNIAERLADGEATEAERWSACADAESAVYAIGHGPPILPRSATEVAAFAVVKQLVPAHAEDFVRRAWDGSIASAAEIANTASEAYELVNKTSTNTFARLVRELFGNPFRPTKVAPHWLAWNDGTVPKIAQAIYDDRAFDRLPILADALEDAGCNNCDILAHCRGGGEHVRGCWVVDLLLGKQ